MQTGLAVSASTFLAGRPTTTVDLKLAYCWNNLVTISDASKCENDYIDASKVWKRNWTLR